VASGRAGAAERTPDTLTELLLGQAQPERSRSDAIGRLLLGDETAPVAPAPIPAAPQRIEVASRAVASPPASTAAPLAGPAPSGTRAGLFSSAAPDGFGALLLAQSGRAAPGPSAGGAPGATRAFDPSAFLAPDPSALLLLLVELDGLTLTDGMAAYGDTDDAYLPIGELTRLLELDVDVSPADGRITGRLGEAGRSLIIDLASGVARVGASDIAISPGDVAVSANEIYLKRSAIERFFPLQLKVSVQSLTMTIVTLELLPIQGRLQRLARQQQGAPAPTTPALRVDEPYHLFTPPSFDIALGTGVQTTRPKTPFRYDIRLGGDLAYMGLQAYVGSDESGRAASARVLLERSSIDGDLLGPLHARSVGIGDVFTPGLAIGPRSLGGRGIAFSTTPLDQTSIFNRVDLRGPLPLGNDVELYVNDVLRGSQNSGDKGQYEFLNVPLTQGLNVVRIVTYGPRGQRNEETRVINASGGLLRPGQTTLEFAATQQDRPLFRVRDVDPFQIDRGVGDPRVVANLNYGLTQYLTLSGGAAIYSTRQGVEKRLVTGGLRTSVGGFATQFDVAGSQGGGSGASVGVAGRVLGANAVLRHAEYRGGLIDENNAEADLDRPLDRRSEITLDRNFAFGSRMIPITLQGLRDVYTDGGTMLSGSVRGSASVGSLLISQGLEYQHETGVSGFNENHLRGLLGISTYRNYRWQIRSNLDYDITPRFNPRILNITADRDISEAWALRFAVNQRLDQSRGTDLVIGSINKTRYGDLALTGEYNTSDSSFRLGLQVNFGLGYNPGTRGYAITRSGPGSGGSVNFHAFLDANGDGRFQPGEAPVANVVLDGGAGVARTNAEGVAYLNGFGAANTARLLVSLNELDNPDVNTLSRVVEFTPRPGGVTDIPYPIRPTAEVMVSLKLRRADQSFVGLSAARLRLNDGRGLVVEGATEFDGTANFQSVPAGSYAVELDPEQAQRLRMRLVAPVTVVVKPDGSATDVEGEVKFDPRIDGDAGPSR